MNSVLDPRFERRIGKLMKELDEKHHGHVGLEIRNDCHLMVGQIKALSSYLQTYRRWSGQKNSFLNLTTTAFAKLKPTDWAAFDLRFQIGFPIGLGAVKYFTDITDPNKLYPGPNLLTDLPDGAEHKLNEIIAGKDPFRDTPLELKGKFFSFLKGRK